MCCYIIEDIMESRILSDASCHLGSHAGSQLIHERQKLVGWNLLHPFLEHTIDEKIKTQETFIISAENELIDLLTFIRSFTNLMP